MPNPNCVHDFIADTITISSAQLLAIDALDIHGNATGIPIILPPGVGKMINLLQVVIRYVYGGTPYTTSGPLALLLQPANDLVSPELSTDLTVTRSTIEIYRTTDVFNSLDNQGVNLLAVGGSPAAGNGKLVITVMYRIEDTDGAA